jgi:mono/diheme cytochrome c family protein
MNKALKYLLYLIGAVVVFALLFVVFIQVKGIPNYEAKDPGGKVEATPVRIAQGKKIVTMVCGSCHMNNETHQLTGHFMDDAPKEFGEIWSKNITNHPTKGIGSWTDGQLKYLFRTGVGRDGRFYPPYMPKFVHMSDEDMNSVIAFLRSDDPWVAAADVDNQPVKTSLLTKMLCNLVFKPVAYPAGPVNAPDIKDKVAYGKYVVMGKVECFSCHSADFKTNNIEFPEKSKGYMGGGNGLLTHEQKKIHSANLTMDKETGIGNWTEEEFIKAVKYGQSPHGPLKYPMMPLSLLEDEEVSAVYAYLKSIPVINNKVNRNLED